MTSTAGRATILAISLVAGACASRETPVPVPSPDVPHRVVDAETGGTIAFHTLADRLVEADVVIFGEQHDDPGTHRLQLALLEALATRRDDVILSLEMFERDVQARLDDYLAGRIDEATFLADARPWPNYATDYRPLVELAKEHGLPVLAANVPRHFASNVATGGLDTLNTLPPTERALIARELECPRDAYYTRFMETMGLHPGEAGDAEARMMRYYEAQCIKDETMAESIVAALADRPGALVVHMVGAFHSDFGHGLPARVLRRFPDARTVVLTGLPVDAPEQATATEERERADYLIFTRKPASDGGGEDDG